MAHIYVSTADTLSARVVIADSHPRILFGDIDFRYCSNSTYVLNVLNVLCTYSSNMYIVRTVHHVRTNNNMYYYCT